MGLGIIIMIVFLLFVSVGLLFAFIAFGGRGKRYVGDAPFKGKVARFTGTSGEIVEEDGTHARSSTTE